LKFGALMKLLIEPGRVNFFIHAPDDLGLTLLLPKALLTIAGTDDIIVQDASILTRARAKEIEAETRRGPVTGAPLTQVYIHRLSEIPDDCVGTLLKTVEDARFARFIFQSQHITKKVMTLRSRSTSVELPFLSRNAVLANLRAQNLDARAADHANLWDGTLSGTIRALSMKDTLASFARETKQGKRGIPALMRDEMINSMAFSTAMQGLLTSREKRFLELSNTPARRRLVTFLAMERN